MRDWQLCLVYANFITMQLRGRTQPQDPAQYPMNYDGRCHEWRLWTVRVCWPCLSLWPTYT